MKRKLVFWGSNEKDEKLLVAIELVEQNNEVNIYTFSEDLATQQLYQDLSNKWKADQEVEFPEQHEKIVRPLSVSEGILPDNIKVERTDVINTAQAEWHFIVLSSKMYEIFRTELTDIGEKIEELTEYSESMWNELKGYWGKVLEQVKSKTLLRDHASNLKDKTNVLFDTLKKLRKEREAVFEKKSQEVKASYFENLDGIDEKIKKGLGFKPIFDDLRSLQNKLKGENVTRSDRNAIWNRIDKMFKEIKNIRFGEGGDQENKGESRLQRRYNGLINAIGKMERSIERDNKELEFQNKRINVTGGQLEMQLRQAKHAMIKERLNSKQVKLDDMLKTKVELEKKMEQEKVREEEKAKKRELEEAKRAAKAKIASEIQEQQQAIGGEDKSKLEVAAAAIAEAKQPVEKKVSETTEEKVSTEAPNTGAISDKVAGSDVESQANTIVESSDMVDAVKEDTVEKPEANPLANIASGAMAAIGTIVEKIEDAVEYVEDKMEDAVDYVEEKVEDIVHKDNAEEE